MIFKLGDACRNCVCRLYIELPAWVKIETKEHHQIEPVAIVGLLDCMSYLLVAGTTDAI